MPEPDLIELFVRPLESLQFRYVISGSVAAMLYGEPRLTNDIDFVVFLRSTDISRLRDAYPSPDFYLPPENIILTEVTRRDKGQFNVVHPASGLKADFYTTGRDELDAWAFRNMREYPFEKIVVRLAPPEYVILRKLEYYREGGSEKHLRDIRAMLAVSGEMINHAQLNDWIEQRHLQAEWQKAR
jgi:hypothetical protein